MNDIINLKRARKARQRAESEAAAAANRAAFGRTKADKAQTMAEAEVARRKLDGHKRDGDE